MNILDLFFPKRCVGCGKIGKYFCLACQKGIRFVATNELICPMCGRAALDGITHPGCQTRYSIDGLTSFFHYDGIIKKAVKSLKYRFVSNLADEFISLVSFPSLPHGIIIPIPLHPSRLRERGFNQAEVLGLQLSQKLHIPQRTDILKRVKKTVPQVNMLKRSDRLKNMEHVFASKIASSDILLFDDVLTTGATMRGAANVLKRAGVKRVWAVTMAR